MQTGEVEQSHVLIISHLFEPSVDRVIGHLEDIGVAWTRFNCEEFPLVCNGQLTIDRSTPGTGSLDLRGQKFFPEQATAVWFRRLAHSPVPKGLSPKDREFLESERSAFLSAFFDLLCNAAWINDRWAERKATSKFYQLRVASQLGLPVPRTCVTNSPDDVLSFMKSVGGKVIFKPISGYSPVGADFSKHFAALPEVLEKFDIEVSRDDEVEIVFSQILSPEKIERLDAIQICPPTFQEYIHKHKEIRVTIIDHHVFSCEIHSQSHKLTEIDFRRIALSSGEERLVHEHHELPERVSSLLIDLMASLNLRFGCIDLVLTPEGEYVFLEINPSGQWLWIEDATGLPISKTLALQLCSKG